MPAPASATFAAAVKIAAQNSLLALIDLGSGPGKFKLRDASDVLLWQTNLTNPAGTVNGTTGVLTVTFAAGTVNAVATGTVAYGQLTDDADTVLWSAPAQAGSTPVAGKVVVNTLAAVVDSPLNPLSLAFDPG